MPRLILEFKGNIVREYHFGTGKYMTIGRRPTNDIVIENLAVSGHHARIEPSEDGIFLTDLKSINGSFVNERLVSTYRLDDGDIITIGKHTLTFSCEEGEFLSEKTGESIDKTMVIDTARHRDMLAKSGSKNISPQSPAKESVGILSYLTKNKDDIKLSKKVTTIGKTPDSDIMVNGFFVGKTAAIISKRPNGFYMSYVTGLSKPRVNTKVLKESVKLKEFDIIKIGPVKMQFKYR